ncbi:MBL fold metallo-hydrolase, partial [Pseudomonas sp. CCC2.2]|nr:MBL fold metallo-hydrolase [Pseudomonas sp. CCC2.2]
LIVPQVMQGNTLELEGHELDVVGLTSRQPERTFVWIPSLKAVVGGVVVADNLHVWMADTQTPQSHRQWLGTLKRIASLQPKIVVPGHYLGENDQSMNSVTFTRDYIKAFDEETLK